MNGIILVDKPEGWTSHDVVGKLRGILHERRIGHSGTLDPMATGLLVVFVGRATRAVEFAESDIKTYNAHLRLGMSTDTQDITGNVLSKCADIPDEAEVIKALDGFRGDIMQIPPMYSAIKIAGKKLYELARRGESVERKARAVTIHELIAVKLSDNEYRLDITCSKGTYVRTLCNDIGVKLACGGCMSALRRTKAGPFSVSDAHGIEEIQQYAEKGRIGELLLPVDTLFTGYESICVGTKDEIKLRNGNIVSCDADDGTYRVYSDSGEFLLIGKIENGKLKTIKSFFEVINEQ